MTRAIAVFLLAVLVSGCRRTAPGMEELGNEVARLTEENAKLRARIDDLEASLSESRETTVVSTSDGGVELRLNLETALVLIAIVSGVVVLLVFFMRYRLLAEQARWQRAPPEEGGGARDPA